MFVSMCLVPILAPLVNLITSITSSIHIKKLSSFPSKKLLVIFPNGGKNQLMRALSCVFCVSLNKQGTMRTRKIQWKWPQGKAQHNELEIATDSFAVSARPVKARTLQGSFSSQHIVILIYKITEDPGLQPNMGITRQGLE